MSIPMGPRPVRLDRPTSLAALQKFTDPDAYMRAPSSRREVLAIVQRVEAHVGALEAHLRHIALGLDVLQAALLARAAVTPEDLQAALDQVRRLLAESSSPADGRGTTPPSGAAIPATSEPDTAADSPTARPETKEA